MEVLVVSSQGSSDWQHPGLIGGQQQRTCSCDLPMHNKNCDHCGTFIPPKLVCDYKRMLPCNMVHCINRNRNHICVMLILRVLANSAVLLRLKFSEIKEVIKTVKKMALSYGPFFEPPPPPMSPCGVSYVSPDLPGVLLSSPFHTPLPMSAHVVTKEIPQF